MSVHKFHHPALRCNVNFSDDATEGSHEAEVGEVDAGEASLTASSEDTDGESLRCHTYFKPPQRPVQ